MLPWIIILSVFGRVLIDYKLALKISFLSGGTELLLAPGLEG